ncbi:unnamed protein product [Paramecium primaurelia]|uniref:Uncharacterized protein n=1 Tax=Paramecium primaurelia TaxID=5886 RepID=A0A8S1LVH6_PARPR|nr:unnamed protein product [Paramecium primaurelia]
MIVHEKLGKQQQLYHFYKFQEQTNNIHVPTHETISSLTEKRFESNETSLDSSLSNDNNHHNQLIELLKTTKHRYQFSKKLY